MINDIISDKKKLFSSDADTELRVQENRTRRVAFVGGNLTANARTEVSGISARVYKNGVYGFSSIAECSSEAAEKVLRAADENASFMSRHAGKGKGLLPNISAPSYDCREAIADPEQKMYIDYVRGLDAIIAEKYPRLISRALVATADSMEKYIVTSGASDAHTILPRSYVYLMFTAMGKDGTPIEMFSPVGGYGTFDKNFTSYDAMNKEADELYEKLMKKCEGVHAEAGIKTCVIGNELTGMLAHEAVGHTVEADLVLGGSVAAGAIGKQVASEAVTLVDYAHTAFGSPTPLPIFYDDEGTPAEDAVIIKDGILVGYMNNRESAEHFGMKPQGNARAYSFSDEPLIRMRNTAINPGKYSLEEMIESIDDGYYFIDTNNGQADTTGEFMFGITYGYEIKHGKLGRALLDTTISGVAFEMLKTVDMIGNEVRWCSSGFCGKKQPMPVGLGGPALRCRLMVGGS